ncbi:MAG: hypothetical protein ACYDDB_07490 [bacterium]
MEILKKKLFVLLGYILISTLFFGWDVIFKINTRFIGIGSDPTQFMWAFYWFPFALIHHKSLLFTHYFFAPKGYNLAWSTSVIGLSFLFAPLTYLLGPVASYNIAMLLAPALAAYGAYLLIKYLTAGSNLSGFIGGYIFGFSSYEIGQTWGHLMITFTCLVPLMVLLFLLKVHKKLNSIGFIILFSLSLILQFFISQEVFTIFNLFGVFSVIVSLFIFKEQRKDMFYAVKDVIFSYIITIIIISPYLYYMLISMPKEAFHNPIHWSTDILNFFIPTHITLIGGKTFSFIASKFRGTYAGEGAYIGLPLIFLLYLYFINFYKTNKGKFLLIIFLMVSVFSLGPFLYIYGINTKIIMPWIVFAFMPILKDALPGRFALYEFLVVAVVAGYFVKEFQTKKWLKWTIMLV